MTTQEIQQRIANEADMRLPEVVDALYDILERYKLLLYDPVTFQPRYSFEALGTLQRDFKYRHG